MKKILLCCLIYSATANAQLDSIRQVSGTKISMRPPLGFETATRFAGFLQTETGSSIMVMEIPGSIKTLSAGFTGEEMIPHGLTLISKDSFPYGDEQAFLIKASQPANGENYIKFILLFGSGEQITMVNGIYPEELDSLEDVIKASLLTATVDSLRPANFLASASYFIHPEQENFQYAFGVAGAVAYTLDGKTPSTHPDSAGFIVATSFEKTSISDINAFARDRMRRLQDADRFTIRQTDSIQIDGVPGIELIAFTKDNEEVLYEVMLVTPDNYYFLMIGTALHNGSKYVDRFKKIAATFRRKNN